MKALLPATFSEYRFHVFSCIFAWTPSRQIFDLSTQNVSFFSCPFLTDSSDIARSITYGQSSEDLTLSNLSCTVYSNL